jgi:hypothetical protein
MKIVAAISRRWRSIIAYRKTQASLRRTKDQNGACQKIDDPFTRQKSSR